MITVVTWGKTAHGKKYSNLNAFIDAYLAFALNFESPENETMCGMVDDAILGNVTVLLHVILYTPSCFYQFHILENYTWKSRRLFII